MDMRVCSLLPSGTEILFALGLGDQVCGVSHECDYPPEARSKPVVVRSAFESKGRSSAEIDGLVREHLQANRGVYELDREVLQALRPDLLLTQALCEVCAISLAAVMRAIQGLSPPPELLSLDPHDVDGVLEDIERVGQRMKCADQAHRLVGDLRERMTAVEARVREAPRPRVVCLEWLDPLMCGGHWVPQMVETAGGQDVLGQRGKEARTISWEELAAAAPEVVVLMPCGFDVERTKAEAEALQGHPVWEALPAVRRGRVYATNASAYFSRPGPRLVEGIELLATLLHPELAPVPAPADRAVALVSSG